MAFPTACCSVGLCRYPGLAHCGSGLAFFTGLQNEVLGGSRYRSLSSQGCCEAYGALSKNLVSATLTSLQGGL